VPLISRGEIMEDKKKEKEEEKLLINGTFQKRAPNKKESLVMAKIVEKIKKAGIEIKSF